jgi:hypothetical protein
LTNTTKILTTFEEDTAQFRDEDDDKIWYTQAHLALLRGRCIQECKRKEKKKEKSWPPAAPFEA